MDSSLTLVLEDPFKQTGGDEPFKFRTVSRGEAVSVGRSGFVDFALNHVSISKKHFAVKSTIQGFEVEDLGSETGTFLNDEMIHTPRIVKRGDRIRAGSLDFRLEAGDWTPPAKPVEEKAKAEPKLAEWQKFLGGGHTKTKFRDD